MTSVAAESSETHTAAASVGSTSLVGVFSPRRRPFDHEACQLHSGDWLREDELPFSGVTGEVTSRKSAEAEVHAIALGCDRIQMISDEKKAVPDRIKVIHGHFYPIADHLNPNEDRFYPIADHLKVIADGKKVSWVGFK